MFIVISTLIISIISFAFNALVMFKIREAEENKGIYEGF